MSLSRNNNKILKSDCESVDLNNQSDIILPLSLIIKTNDKNAVQCQKKLKPLDSNKKSLNLSDYFNSLQETKLKLKDETHSKILCEND
jgi:hypothetical protein